MELEYITRRKLIKLFKYIKNKKWKVTVIDHHDCSYEGCRYYNEYTGTIEDFNVINYEDAQIKLLITFDTTNAEIWLSNSYYIYSFNLHNEIHYTSNNGDGTYSDFIIKIVN